MTLKLDDRKSSSEARVARLGWLRSNSLGSRLLRSHMAVAAIGLALLGVSLLFTIYLRARTAELARIDAPMAEASRAALQGVARSLADLRGWMVIRDEHFIASRRQAWAEQIEPAMARLKRLNQRGGESDRQRLQEAGQLLSELKEVQWWIEDVAQTPGNNPASDLFVNRMQPAIDEIFTIITAMIEEEKLSRDSGRPNRMLAAMADFRGSFSRSGASLGSLLQTGGSSGESAVRAQLAVAQSRMRDLAADSASLTGEQMDLFGRLKIQLPHFISLSEEIIARRRTPEWNVAQFLLREEALAKSREITARLNVLAEERAQLVAENAEKLDRLSQVAIGLSSLFSSAWRPRPGSSLAEARRVSSGR